MAHHHHHHARLHPLIPAAGATAATVAAVEPPTSDFPPQVALWRQWGEPLLCTVLTLVCFNRALKRLDFHVTDWGLAVRSMVWPILAFGLLADLTIGLGTAAAEYLATTMTFAPLWVHTVTLEFAAIVLISGIGGLALAHYFRAHTRKLGGTDRPVRGTYIFDGAIWQARTAKERAKILKAGGVPPIRFAGCAIAPKDEIMHFVAMGTTGSGKSTAIRSTLADAQDRGDRAIIADPDGGYLARFYNAERGDIILNPFDARSVCWSPLDEVAASYQADQLALSLIPDVGGDSQWTKYSRTFLACVLRQGRSAGLETAGDIHKLIVSAPLAELRALLAGTAAAPFLEEGSEKQFAGTRSTASDAVAGLGHVADGPKGEPFSITEWAKSDRPGWLFLPYQADQIASLSGMIAAWLRLAMYATMSRGEADSHTWFVVDELDALGKINDLPSGMVRLRKFGGRCMLGLQSIGPLSDIYGRGMAAALIENAGNKLILRCSASEGGGTAAFASQLIGKRDVWRASSNTGESSSAHIKGSTRGRSSGVTWSIVTEDAVTAAEIEALPDLTGYLKSPSVKGWAKLSFEYDGMPMLHPAFVPIAQKD